MSGVRNPSSPAPAEAGTSGSGSGPEPFDDAHVAVHRVLPRFPRDARRHGAAAQDVLRQAGTYLNVAGGRPRLLAPEKHSGLPFYLARSVSACQTHPRG